MGKIRTFAWSGPHLRKHLERLARACLPEDERMLVGLVLRHDRNLPGPLPAPFSLVGKTSRWPGTRGHRATVWVAHHHTLSPLAAALDQAHHCGAEDPFFWNPSRDGKQFARLATSEYEGVVWATLPEDDNAREPSLLAAGFTLDRAEAPGWLEVNSAWKLP
jgi:hypothetical protein